METITFKVDGALAEAMSGIDNRSDFIRNAILSALGHICPLCDGSGILSASQREHWKLFAEHHHLHTCNDCRGVHLVCDLEE